MDGYEIVHIDDVISEVDFVITATGNAKVVTAEQLRALKPGAIVGNVGHFDNELDLAGLQRSGDVDIVSIKPQVDEWSIREGTSFIVLSAGRLLNLGNATGHPSFVMSASFTNQVMAQMELFTHSERYSIGVHRLAKELDEKVARLHLPSLGAKLSTLTPEQADYIGVTVDGPYKPEHYRY